MSKADDSLPLRMNWRNLFINFHLTSLNWKFPKRDSLKTRKTQKVQIKSSNLSHHCTYFLPWSLLCILLYFLFLILKKSEQQHSARKSTKKSILFKTSIFPSRKIMVWRFQVGLRIWGMNAWYFSWNPCSSMEWGNTGCTWNEKWY